MLFAAILISAILAVILGGDLRRLAALEVKRFPWIFASLVIRYFAEGLVVNTPSVISSAAAIIVSYGPLFYGLAANVRDPSMRIVLIGSASNFLVIALNSFRMPVRLDLFEAGLQTQEAARLAGSVTHRVLDASTRVPYLSDVLAWNYFTKKPSVFSVGDILIVIGVAYLVLRAAKPRFLR